MNTWAHIENIVVLACATFLAYVWNSGWPFFLLIMINYPKSRTNGNQD